MINAENRASVYRVQLAARVHCPRRPGYSEARYARLLSSEGLYELKAVEHTVLQSTESLNQAVRVFVSFCGQKERREKVKIGSGGAD